MWASLLGRLTLDPGKQVVRRFLWVLLVNRFHLFSLLSRGSEREVCVCVCVRARARVCVCVRGGRGRRGGGGGELGGYDWRKCKRFKSE